VRPSATAMPSEQPEIAHRESEREAAKPPHRAPEPAPGERLARGRGEHAEQVRRLQRCEDPRCDEPREEPPVIQKISHDPAPDALVGHVEARGRQSAKPVEEHARARDLRPRVGLRG
jgi:hypothetical protein